MKKREEAKRRGKEEEIKRVGRGKQKGDIGPITIRTQCDARQVGHSHLHQFLELLQTQAAVVDVAVARCHQSAVNGYL